ncbi:MAG: P-loop NTPase [Patescibacteria group bacterium]|nr:P-loop NTPase [Patescibacteria group bacterium]
MDPRPNIINQRLKNIKTIIAVSGGKGGIGKSSIASVLALNLAKNGLKTGLLDLDFCGPSTHTILGINNLFPKEDKGIIPPEFEGLKFMSIIYYTGKKPALLRGEDISNIILELLTITQWGDLDFLVIDMPPGIGDAALDILKLVKKTKFLIVATPSKTTMETVNKNIKMLKELKAPILGIIENYQSHQFLKTKTESKISGVPILGKINFDKKFESAIGNTDKLLKTDFSRDLLKIIQKAILRHKNTA